MLNAVEALRAVIFLSAIFFSYGYVTGLATVEEYALGLRIHTKGIVLDALLLNLLGNFS